MINHHTYNWNWSFFCFFLFLSWMKQSKCYLEQSSTNSTLTRNRRNWVLELICSVLPLANVESAAPIGCFCDSVAQGQPRVSRFSVIVIGETTTIWRIIGGFSPFYLSQWLSTCKINVQFQMNLSTLNRALWPSGVHHESIHHIFSSFLISTAR